MRFVIACALCSTIAAAFGGCSSAKRLTFDITVHNKTAIPVMLWLTKDGPPAEKGWLTTEQFLEASPDEPSPGVQLPPQKSADTGKVTGAFPDGTHAILLIYRTGPDAAAPGRSKPLAVQLRAGRNELAVAADDTGRLLVYDPVAGAAASPIVKEP